MNKNKHIIYNETFKENFFIVPDNYFSDFSDKLLLKINKTKSQRKVIFLSKNFAWAALLIIILSTLFTLYFLNYSERGINKNDYVAMIDYELDELDITELIAADAQIEINTINQNEVINYLLDEKIDYTDIINEISEQN